ncbi:MAG TPA: hypothetical protein VFS49_08570 [Croceibacterium sp.]|nr:hypothetical protein [Croceibacterium sp.]
MPTVFLAFIAAALVTLAGREATRVARLSAALGASLVLFAACWLAALVACALAASAGAALAAELAPETRAAFVAVALAVAAVELLVLRPAAAPAEPTRSFGAVALVLVTAQLVAGAGLPVLAAAVWSGSPWPAAAGGALGTGAVLSLAWRIGRAWNPRRVPLALVRYAVAALLLALAAIAAAGVR